MMNVRQGVFLALLAANCIYGQPLLAGPGAVAPDPSVPLAKITPNGIIALFGKPQVLFKVSPPDQSVAPEQSFLLSEGERRQGIAVKKIDAHAGVITFDNHGVVQKLSLVTGSAWSSVEGSAAGGTDTNTLTNPSRHRLVRQLNLADDPRRQVATDPDQAIPVSGASGFAPLPSGGPVEAVSQPVDNSQKLAASAAADPAMAASQPTEQGTPAELAAQDIAAGGDVPPPPPVTGN